MHMNKSKGEILMDSNNESKTATPHEDVKPNTSGSGWLFVLGGKCFTSDDINTNDKENYNHGSED